MADAAVLSHRVCIGLAAFVLGSLWQTVMEVKKLTDNNSRPSSGHLLLKTLIALVWGMGCVIWISLLHVQDMSFAVPLSLALSVAPVTLNLLRC